MQRKTTKKALARALAPLPEGAQAVVDQMVRVRWLQRRGRASRRTLAAKGRCVHAERATEAIRQRRVEKSSDRRRSVYAPSSRSSGASCTSLMPSARLHREPVGVGALMSEMGTMRAGRCRWT